MCRVLVSAIVLAALTAQSAAAATNRNETLGNFSFATPSVIDQLIDTQGISGTAVVTIGTAMSITVAAFDPTVATLVPKLSSIALHLRCSLEDGPQPSPEPWAEPSGVAVNSDWYVAKFLGGAIINLSIVAVIVGVTALVYRKAAEVGRIAVLCGIAQAELTLFLVPPAVGSCVAAIVHATETGAAIVAIVLLVIALLIVAYLALQVNVHRHASVRASLELLACDTRLGLRYEFESSDEREAYVACYAPLFSSVNELSSRVSRNYYFIELLIACVVCSTGMVQPSSHECGFLALITAAAVAIQVLYFGLVRPFRTRLDTIWSIVCAIGCTGFAVMTAMGSGTTSEELLGPAAFVVTLLLLLPIALLGFHILWSVMVHRGATRGQVIMSRASADSQSSAPSSSAPAPSSSAAGRGRASSNAVVVGPPRSMRRSSGSNSELEVPMLDSDTEVAKTKKKTTRRGEKTVDAQSSNGLTSGEGSQQNSSGPRGNADPLAISDVGATNKTDQKQRGAEEAFSWPQELLDEGPSAEAKRPLQGEERQAQSAKLSGDTSATIEDDLAMMERLLKARMLGKESTSPAGSPIAPAAPASAAHAPPVPGAAAPPAAGNQKKKPDRSLADLQSRIRQHQK